VHSYNPCVITLWECVQGLLFMVVFGGVTRAGLQDRPRKRSSAPLAASQAAVRLPAPRGASEEEYGSLPIG
jgi:hypothetical protein